MKNTKVKNIDMKNNPKINKLAVDIARIVTGQLIENGIIDSEYENFGELAKDVRLCLPKHFLENPINDYGTTILKYAKESIEGKNYLMSCIAYGTWTEHYINGLIITICQRKNIPNECGLGLIRKCSLEDKFTWVLRLLGGPCITKKHCDSITRINGYRNYYVHYKWQSRNDIFENEIINSLNEYPKTISYLQRVRSRYLYNGRKTKIDKIMGKRK